MNEFHPKNPTPPSSSPSTWGTPSSASSTSREENGVANATVPVSIAVWTPAARRNDQPDAENSPHLGKPEARFNERGRQLTDRMMRRERAQGNLTPFADHGDGCWGWQLPLFPGYFPTLPPIDDPTVSNDLDDRLPDGDMPGQLLLDLDL